MMPRILPAALVLLCCFQVATCADAPAADEKDVTVLTPANFADVTKKGNALVEFYAPWCGHCQQLVPEYAKAATELKTLFPEVTLGKVDADEHKDLGQKFEVKGFPTLKWFTSETDFSDYEGGRTSDGIVAWIKKRMGPATVALADKAAVEAFKASGKAGVIGYFAKPEGALYLAFEAAAKDIDDVEFAVAAVGGKEGDVVLYKGVEPKESTFAGEVTKDEVKKFVATHRLGYVTKFSQEISSAIFGSPVKTQMLLFGDADDAAVKPVLETYTKVAADNMGKFVAVHVETDMKQILEFFGVTADEVPTLFAVIAPEGGGGMKKFKGPSKEEIGKAGVLEAWVKDYMDGKIAAHLKSEPAPDPAVDEHGVTTLVGTTLKETINDATKDVLVEFYAPWCGHCKQLVPIYDKLGKEFKAIDTVVIAKMDATANDTPEELAIQGFPTIMFWKAAEGAKGVVFEGERTLKGFRSYIKKEAGSTFVLEKKKKPASAEL